MSSALFRPRAHGPQTARGEIRGRPSAAVLLKPGPFDFDSLTGPECFGLLVLGGLITAELRAGRAHVACLLGADDLIRPWEMGELDLTQQARWQTLTPTRLLPVAAEFHDLASRSPESVHQALSRAARTSHWLMAMSLILSAPSIEERLVLLFTLYGERWGKVTPRGVCLDLPLTHELVGNLCGARRPTVTLALKALDKQGFLVRISNERWLLPQDTATNKPWCHPT